DFIGAHKWWLLGGAAVAALFWLSLERAPAKIDWAMEPKYAPPKNKRAPRSWAALGFAPRVQRSARLDEFGLPAELLSGYEARDAILRARKGQQLDLKQLQKVKRLPLGKRIAIGKSMTRKVA